MGAATGLDSGEARSRRRMPSNATAPTTKNSLCQFWNDWNQNCEGVMNLSTDTACRRGDLLAVELDRPPMAWTVKQARKMPNSTSAKECS
jgi:hypothetical protein